MTKLSEIVLGTACRTLEPWSSHRRRRSPAEGRRMSCWETIGHMRFAAIGIGENLLPKTDFTLCQQFTLIGSGMIWNIYFGAAGAGGRVLSGQCLALAKSAAQPVVPQTCRMVHLRLSRLAAVHPVLPGL